MIASLPLILSFAAFAAEDAPPLPDVETVRVRYLDAVTSVHTLDYRMKFDWIQLREGLQNENSFVTHDVHFQRRRARAAKDSVGIQKSGVRRSHTWLSFDGQRYTRWWEELVPTFQTALPAGSIKFEQDNELIQDLSIEELSGTTLQSGYYPLSRLLKLNGSRVAAWEDVDGHRCLKVEMPIHGRYRSDVETYQSQTTAWFDPEQRWLPRKIVIFDLKGPKDERERTSTIIATEFRKFDGGDGHKYVLPVAGWKNQHDIVRKEIVARDIVVNGELGDGTFEPTFPDLCQVREERLEGPNRDYVVGGADRRTEEQEKRRLGLILHPPVPPPVPPEGAEVALPRAAAAAPAVMPNLPPTIISAPREVAVRYATPGGARRTFELRIYENAADPPWLKSFTGTRPDVAVQIEPPADDARAGRAIVLRTYRCTVIGTIANEPGAFTAAELMPQGDKPLAREFQPIRVLFEHRPGWRPYPAAMAIPANADGAEFTRQITILGDDGPLPELAVGSLPDHVIATWQPSDNPRVRRLTVTQTKPPWTNFSLKVFPTAELFPEVEIPVVFVRN